jgi:hypothetical protein
MPHVDVAIADPVQEPMRRGRGHLHSERVADYLHHLDQSPPVTVFDINRHLLLADGHHRVHAAQQLGRNTIKAVVRRGSRGDALRFAIDLAREQGGLSEEEALAAIERRADRGDIPV